MRNQLPPPPAREHSSVSLYGFSQALPRICIVTVAHIHHQHRKADIDMKLLFRNAQIGSRTLHVTHNTVRVGKTLDKHFSRAKQKIDPTMQLLVMGLYSRH